MSQWKSWKQIRPPFRKIVWLSCHILLCISIRERSSSAKKQWLFLAVKCQKSVWEESLSYMVIKWRSTDVMGTELNWNSDLQVSKFPLKSSLWKSGSHDSQSNLTLQKKNLRQISSWLTQCSESKLQGVCFWLFILRVGLKIVLPLKISLDLVQLRRSHPLDKFSSHH